MTLPGRLAAIHAAAVAKPWTAPEIATLLQNPLVFALEEGPAFLLARTVADEAELLMVATHPAQRRKGLAASLLTRFHGAARQRGAQRAFLEVAEDNAAACALYAKAGYTEVGRRKGYYSRADAPAADALILSSSIA